MKKLTVNVGKTYEIIIEKGIMQECGAYIKKVSSAKKVCVITDSNVAPLYLDRVVSGLEKEGYEVDCAYSAEEALDMDLGLYQLFMVDIMMDQLSGYDFAKRVRNVTETEQTPILFFSAHTDEDAVEGTQYRRRRLCDQAFCHRRGACARARHPSPHRSAVQAHCRRHRSRTGDLRDRHHFQGAANRPQRQGMLSRQRAGDTDTYRVRHPVVLPHPPQPYLQPRGDYTQRMGRRSSGVAAYH